MSQPNETPTDDLRAWIRESHANGRSVHGDLGLSAEVHARHAIAWFERRLKEVAAPHDPAARAALRDLAPGADLYLRLAFEHGIRQRAMIALQAACDRIVPVALRRQGASNEQAEVITAEIFENLAVGAFRRDGRPGFLGYGARSALPAWLAGVAAQQWRQRARSESRRPDRALSALPSIAETDDDWPLTSAVAVSPQAGEPDLPELLEDALRATAEADRVAPTDLHAFAASTLSRRPHQDLAARYGVPPSTFSRRKDRGARDLQQGLRDHLVQRTGPAEFVHLQSGIDPDRPRADTRLLQVLRRFCWSSIRRIGRSFLTPNPTRPTR